MIKKYIFFRLLGLYQCLHHRLHSPSRPLKLIFQQLDKETMLAWVSKNLYDREIFSLIKKKIISRWLLVLNYM